MKIRTVVGLDVGRSAIKVVAYACGARFTIMFPTLAVPAVDLTDPSTAERAKAETEIVNGKGYFTGDTARLQGNLTTTIGLNDDWTDTPEYLALVKSAFTRLHKAGVPNLDSAYVVIGTPSKLYGTRQLSLVEKTKTALPKEVEIKALPQPMGAYCDFVLDKSGLPIKDKLIGPGGRTKSYGVIEGGHFSTDFLLMKEGQYIERGADSCAGMSAAAEQLRRILAPKGLTASLVECEEAFRTKTLFQFGEETPIGNEVLGAQSHVVQEIIAKGNSLFAGDARSLNGVLIAGGSAEAIYAIASQSWKHSILMENPRWSVADGFARYALGQLIRASVSTTHAVAANG
ncbi:ParM/StbA family protein [Pseudomonas cichorii]|nr:ParM/StbA family protein [Pseudomonas cichorii]MBX8557070.1 ParM/StbA family protein [Pseudomonas cichorii]MBX8591971.1 ParM/StbA family protein [Pseudomonas cichorii]